ncbi:uncharacterized protein TNCV_1511231 [Trichonephila clavipes]|nr:uncharacterized protein TNCV_1511231 [Trichonephila clavipes]
MITNFFIPELNTHDVQELRFQQDGATCHTARATIDLLKDTLGDRLISRFGPVNWPPRSCDLTPLDYFLWVYVKSLVYADKPQTLDHLEDNVRRVIADIRPQMLEKVIENWTSRLDYIRASRGSPTPDIIFKIFRLNSWTSYRFPITDRDSDHSRISSVRIAPYFAVSHRFPLSQKGPHMDSLKNTIFRWRGFTTAPSNPISFLSSALPLYHSLSPHLSPPNHPSVIYCSSAAPVGLGSLDLLSFCRPYRSQLISSLAQ